MVTCTPGRLQGSGGAGDTIGGCTFYTEVLSVLVSPCHLSYIIISRYTKTAVYIIQENFGTRTFWG